MKITKGLIASIIIIAISGLAITTGFLKEGVVSQIEENRIAVSDVEIIVERMESKISDIFFLIIIELMMLI